MNWLMNLRNLRYLRGNSKLIWRLMRDGRTPTYLKALPVLGAIYAVVPFDLLPMLPFDDITVMLGVVSAFMYLAPDEAIEEHRSALGMLDNTV